MTARVVANHGSSAPTGSLSLLVDGVQAQSFPLASNATAEMSLMSLPRGKHQVSVVYSGDSNVEASTSNTLSLFFQSKVSRPVFSIASGTYDHSLTVEITSATAGNTIYYTTNGSMPSASSQVYTQPLILSTSQTLHAYAVVDQAFDSLVSTASYIIQPVSHIDVSGQTATYGAPAVSLGASISYTADTPPSGKVTVSVDNRPAVPATCVGSSTPLICTVAYVADGLQAGSHTFTVTEAADAVYALASTTGTLTIDQATPTVTWTAPPAVIYGTALSSVQLNASANIPGGFTYSPSVGAVFDAGPHALTVTFTPTDTTDYRATSKSVSLVVGKQPSNASLALSANALDPGQVLVLTAKISGATSSVPSGTVAFFSCSNRSASFRNFRQTASLGPNHANRTFADSRKPRSRRSDWMRIKE